MFSVNKEFEFDMYSVDQTKPNDEDLFRTIDTNVGYSSLDGTSSTCPNILQVPHITRFNALCFRGRNE